MAISRLIIYPATFHDRSIDVTLYFLEQDGKVEVTVSHVEQEDSLAVMHVSVPQTTPQADGTYLRWISMVDGREQSRAWSNLADSPPEVVYNHLATNIANYLGVQNGEFQRFQEEVSGPITDFVNAVVFSPGVLDLIPDGARISLQPYWREGAHSNLRVGSVYVKFV